MDLIDLKSENVSWENVKRVLLLQSDLLTPEEFMESDVTKKVIALLKKQLLDDKSAITNSKEISPCAKYAPRLHCGLDKKTGMAHKLSVELYPPTDNTHEKLVVSYIRYQRLLSTLTKHYNDQEKAKYDLTTSFKKARLNEHKNLWCSLKNRPLSKQVLTPTPMPVTIASHEDLEPLLSFLKSEQSIIPENTNTLGSYMKFDKCAIFTDGRLDLCKQGIGSKWIGTLLDHVKGNKYISDFLSGNNVGNIDGAQAIAKFLKEDHKAKIQTWYLAGNCIDSEGIRIICEALKTDPDMKYLWLKRNPLQPEGIKYIADLLKNNNNIKILDLHNTAVFDEGMTYLVEGLRNNKSLRHLYLDANGITFKGIEPLAQYFKERKEKGITSLWMDMNRLDDDGIICLLESLKDYPYLKRLNIGSNRGTWKSAKALYENLVNHKKLIMLDIGLYKATADMGELSNRITDTGASYIAKFITENKSVKLLSCIHNDISTIGIREIVEAVEKNDTLLYLHLAQYGLTIPQSFIMKIDKKLEENKKRIENPVLKDARFIRHSEKIRLIDSIYRNKN